MTRNHPTNVIHYLHQQWKYLYKTMDLTPWLGFYARRVIALAIQPTVCFVKTFSQKFAEIAFIVKAAYSD